MAPSLRVLIVEDEALLAISAEDSLVEAGFEVVAVVPDHASAVDAAVAHRPDVVVMDIHLARRSDGVAAAIEIHERTGIRCLFASAVGDAETRRRAEAARPLGWLTKPYSTSGLVAALAGLRLR